MFCPRCRSQYEEGATECSDCKVPLVSQLPPEPEPKFVDFEQVLTTFNPADIAIIKSILDAVQVQYFFKGEHFNQVRPMALPAILMVRKDQAQEARDILKDLKIRFSSISSERYSQEEKDS